MKGYNVWILNEGLADVDEEVTLTKDEMAKLGLYVNINKE